ncbi:MAG: Antiholin-like protein LrgA [Candidatus Celerinatantimonas neptuna]|nr:MAG: Antiholin-like protein LrgA [Candidatus Celerinatantimonas neptuna]
MNRLQSFALTIVQVIVLTLFWLVAQRVVQYFHFPIPANLVGMILLFIFILTGVVRADWLRKGATWLVAEMLLFFVPAVMAVMKYPTLIRQHGLQIVSVIFLSTLCVIIVTAIVVDRMHRIELGLALRHRRHQALKNAKRRDQ